MGPVNWRTSLIRGLLQNQLIITIATTPFRFKLSRDSSRVQFSPVYNHFCNILTKSCQGLVFNQLVIDLNKSTRFKSDSFLDRMTKVDPLEKVKSLILDVLARVFFSLSLILTKLHCLWSRRYFHEKHIISSKR